MHRIEASVRVGSSLAFSAGAWLLDCAVCDYLERSLRQIGVFPWANLDLERGRTAGHF